MGNVNKRMNRITDIVEPHVALHSRCGFLCFVLDLVLVVSALEYSEPLHHPSTNILSKAA